MPLSVGDKQNFDTLRRAMLAGDAALLECQSVATGSPVAVVCAANRLADDGAEFVPWLCCSPTTLTAPSIRPTLTAGSIRRRRPMSDRIPADIWIGGKIAASSFPLCVQQSPTKVCPWNGAMPVSDPPGPMT